MDRRTYLRTLGSTAAIASIAGCSSGDNDGSTNDSATNGSGASATTDSAGTPASTDTQNTGAEATTRHESMASEATTAGDAATATPDSDVSKLLAADALGDGWTYADDAAPTVRSNGVIRTTYRSTRGYARTVRTLLWPCSGQTLDALGGTCSLGQIPDQQRANDSVETDDTLSIGTTAFEWWSGREIDLEVVVNGYVFRMTHLPLESDAASSVPSREERMNELHEFARKQTAKLAGLPSGSQ